MKKHLCMAVAACGLLSLASCSEDENVIINDQPVVEEGVQEIVLQVSNAGDDELSTRAARPLLSSQALQSIDKVRVMILKDAADGSKDVAAVKDFNDWMNESAVYTDNGHGREATWKLSGDDKLEPGAYQVYAIGYTSQAEGTIYDGNLIDWWEGRDNGTNKALGTFPVGWSIADDNISAGKIGEEIFAGEIAKIYVTEDGNFSETDEASLEEGSNPNFNVLTLHRQVAGTFGYFTSIPTNAVGKDGVDVNNLYLRLVARNANSKLLFGQFNSSFTSNEDENSEIMYVVNGYNSIEKNISFITEGMKDEADGGYNYLSTDNNDGCIVYEIPLGEWFPHGDVNGDNLLDAADAVEDGNWNSPSNVQAGSFMPGSVFGSSFIIPVLKDAEGASSLQLQLVAKYGDAAYKPLRYWNINLAKDDEQIDRHAYYVKEDGAPAFSQPEDWNIDETRSSYSLFRNHLYTVGVKETDEFDPDTDEPEDLSKGQNLILRVNDNWELVHQMVID